MCDRKRPYEKPGIPILFEIFINAFPEHFTKNLKTKSDYQYFLIQNLESVSFMEFS